MYALGLVARWAHLTSSIFLVGVAAMIVIAGRAERTTARHWEARMLSWARWLAVAAFASGLVVLAVQTALFEGRPSAALEISMCEAYRPSKSSREGYGCTVGVDRPAAPPREPLSEAHQKPHPRCAQPPCGR